MSDKKQLPRFYLIGAHFNAWLTINVHGKVLEIALRRDNGQINVHHDLVLDFVSTHYTDMYDPPGFIKEYK